MSSGIVARDDALPVMIEPIEGECFSGFVQRAAAACFYTSSTDVLIQAGLGARSPASIASTAVGHEEALARALGVKDGANAIRPMLYPPMPDRPGWHEFFGIALRNVHRTTLLRRVSPLGLRRSPHIRAVWSILVFSFDPATKETLIEACPECHRSLGYGRTRGISFCDNCTRVDAEGFIRGKVDLRDYPQQIVEVADLEALDFVTALIDPNPDVRRCFHPRLPDTFAGCDRSELFEFIVALACAITAEPSHASKTLQRPSRKADYMRLRPEALALAGRAVLSWPGGFHAIADEVRADASQRSGHFGIKKELAPLLALCSDPHVDPRIRAVVRDSLDTDMARTAAILPTVRRSENRYRGDLIATQAASRKYGIRRKLFARLTTDPRVTTIREPGAKKAPVLFVDHEIASLALARADLVSASSAAVELGVPSAALKELAEADLLTREDGPVLLLMVGNEYYRRSSLDRLSAKVYALARTGSPPLAAVRLTKAMNRLGAIGGIRWAAIFAAILEERLPVWRVEGRLTALMTTLAAPDIGSISDLIVDPEVRRIGDSKVRISQAEAAYLLGVSAVSVCGLVASGLLSEPLSRSSVREFAARYTMTPEATRKLRDCGWQLRPRDTPSELRKRGIQPQATLTHGRAFVWARSDVESVAAWAASRNVASCEGFRT